MDRKFLSLKKVVVPVISLVIMFSSMVSTLALSEEDLAKLMSNNKYVTVEVLETMRDFGLSEKTIENILKRMMEANDLIEYEEFDDVKPGEWYYEDVTRARAYGIVNGIGDNKFAPMNTITYAEYITTLVRILDSDIDKSSNDNKGSHWSDKYIAKARELGILGKSEAIDVNKGIPRQDMVKYTCKALELEPADVRYALMIFDDVPEEERPILEMAFKEYLTEGTGFSESGFRKFGYNLTSNRAELGTMALRVMKYIENPTLFKIEKVKEREEREKAHWEKLGYKMFNGYKIPLGFETYREDVFKGSSEQPIRKDLDFKAYVYVREPENLDKMQVILASKLGEDVAREAIEYAKKKKVKEYDLPLKGFHKNDKIWVDVGSPEASPIIVFEVTIED